MVWWVFRAASRVELLDEVYVATEDRRVKRVCDQYNIPVIMTSDKHKTPNDRIYEVSTKVNSDIYVVILGDEPLIEPDAIRAVLPDRERMSEFYVTNLVTEIKDPAQVIDCTNNKLITNQKNEIIPCTRWRPSGYGPPHQPPPTSE